MKKVLLLCLLITNMVVAFAQKYTVTHVNGHVYWGNKLLNVKDKIVAGEKLTAQEKDAEVGLLSIRGRQFFNFNSGKPVRNQTHPEHSEFFELTVGDFIKNYDSKKLTATKGEFDFINFFNDPEGNPDMHIMILTNECLPIRSSLLKIYPEDQFFLCFPEKKDTIFALLPRTPDAICFPDSLPQINSKLYTKCLLKMRYMSNSKVYFQYFPHVLEIKMVGESEIEKVLQVFCEQFKPLYHEQQTQLFDALRDELNYTYGRFNEDILTNLIEENLSK